MSHLQHLEDERGADDFTIALSNFELLVAAIPADAPAVPPTTAPITKPTGAPTPPVTAAPTAAPPRAPAIAPPEPVARGINCGKKKIRI